MLEIKMKLVLALVISIPVSIILLPYVKKVFYAVMSRYTGLMMRLDLTIPGLDRILASRLFDCLRIDSEEDEAEGEEASIAGIAGPARSCGDKEV